MFKYIALALLVATTDASYLQHRMAKASKPQPKTNLLAQLMQPSVDDIMGMFDENEDGEISEDEFISTLKRLGGEYKPTKEEVKEAMDMFHKADLNGDDSLSRAEVKALLATMM